MAVVAVLVLAPLHFGGIVPIIQFHKKRKTVIALIDNIARAVRLIVVKGGGHCQCRQARLFNITKEIFAFGAFFATCGG